MPTSDLLKELRIDRDTRPRRRVRGRWLAVAVVALLALAAGAWLVWARVAPPTVRTVAARAATAAGGAGSVLDASGYVTARRQATVSAKITGKVTEVMIEEGQRVKEGEIRALLAQAERDYTRQQELAARQLVAAQTLDAAVAQRDMLRARLTNNVEQVRVAVESVSVAQVQLDNTVIRAPFSGVVIAKSAQPGEMISPISAGGGFTRTGIGTIVDMDSLEIQVDVNESFINRVTAEQPVEATLNAYPDWKIPGSVIAIIPTADRSKATVKVRVAIKSKDARIVPDMGVRVAFLTTQPAAGAPPPPSPAVLVPADAVRGEGAAAVVFVLASERVERRSVTPGSAVGAEREIVKGLRAGERVVVTPPPGLKDGDTVRVGESPR